MLTIANTSTPIADLYTYMPPQGREDGIPYQHNLYGEPENQELTPSQRQAVRDALKEGGVEAGRTAFDQSMRELYGGGYPGEQQDREPAGHGNATLGR